MARWKNLLPHSGSLRTVTCAASTRKKRNKALSCLLICPQPSSFTTGFFRWNQTEIAGDLLAAPKQLNLSDDQHEGQRRQGTYSGMGHQSLRRGIFLHFLFDLVRQLRDRWVQSIQ